MADAELPLCVCGHAYSQHYEKNPQACRACPCSDYRRGSVRLLQEGEVRLNRLDRIERQLAQLSNYMEALMEGLRAEHTFAVELGHHVRGCPFCGAEGICAVARAMVEEVQRAG